METQTVNVFRENTAEEVKKKMTAGEKTVTAGVTAECTVLTVQGKGMPQEQPADGIKSFTEFVGEMSDYDRPVALPHMEKKRVLDKEVRVIMDDCGHRLYAWMDMDADGRMSVTAVQHYRDGGISPEWSMKKSDIIISSIALERGMNNMMEKKIKRFLDRMYCDYLDMFDGDRDEAMTAGDIVRLLAHELRNLPVYSDGIWEMKREELYRRVVGVVECLASQVCNDHKAYYPVDDGEMEYIAGSLGLRKEQLLKRLDEYNLLHKTTSMNGGYKANVNFGDYTARRYCIKRNIGYDLGMGSESDTAFDF